ncbi:hypothetical protein Tco_1259424 [Tanacetum coccineum]
MHSQPTVPSVKPRTHSYGTKRKSLGARKKSFTELDLTADDRSFIRVLSDNSNDSNDDDDPPILWPAFAAWEVVPTGLGDVNALYFMDKPSKYFTHLMEILHLVDRKDLFKLYGMVYGAGVLADQQAMDTPYPLSAQLMKKMLKHKLEVEIDGIGNDMTYAEQLILFIKNRLLLVLLQHDTDADFLVANSKFMKVAFGVGFKDDCCSILWYVVPTGRVKVPAGRYVVPTGKDNVTVSAGRTKVIPAGSTILVLVVLCLLRVDSKVS